MTGQICGFGGLTAPSGWLLCDGASYNIADKPDLFNIIGYLYGGSGATFKVPDLRGRSVIGAGQGLELTARTLGSSLGTEKITNVPEHVHAVKCSTGDGDDTNPQGRVAASSFAVGEDLFADSANADMAATSNTGVVGGVDVMNPHTVINFIIEE